MDRIRVCSLLLLLSSVVLLGARNLTRAQSSVGLYQDDKVQLPPTYVPSGKQMYKEYCASCHGVDGKGRGPTTPFFRKPAPNLTRLSTKYAGKFPVEYVAAVLRFGPGLAAHGSSDMPVWGPLFQYLDQYNEAAVRQRIKNLCDYLESIQEK